MKIVKEFFIKKRITIDCNDYNIINEKIKLYNGKTNIYESLYYYKNKINNDNVIVDRIFLDFDCKGNFLENARRIAKYFMDNSIKFFIRFSGRGFHIFPFIKKDDSIDYRNAIRNYVDHLHHKNDTESDLAVVGDLRRLCRVPHTINIKSGLYCIPLTYEDLQNKTYKEICEYAMKDRNKKDIFYGDTLIDLKEYDFYNAANDYNSYYYRNEGVDVINIDKFSPCINAFLSDLYLGYKERTDLIIYLRDMGYSYDDVIQILEEHLSEEKFNHCVYEEKQVQRLFEKDMLLMRSCNTLRSLDLCPSKFCQGNNLYL